MPAPRLPTPSLPLPLLRTLALAAAFAALACKAPTTEATAAPDAAPAAACVSRIGLGATVWNMTAAEYRASTLQTYALARAELDRALADGMRTAAPEQQGDVRDLPPAVILDVDETVLDNSPYQGWLAQEGRRFEPATWSAWVEARQGRAIAGAVEFTTYAAAKGVTVFYVSNRDVSGEAATRDNLKALGFPLAAGDDLDVVLLKNERPEWGSAKGTRRAAVAAGFRVVMLVGDNLGDFTDAYKGTIGERAAVVDQAGDAWGSRWIMIPNPMYGAWEEAAAAGPTATSAEHEEALVRAAATWAGPG